MNKLAYIMILTGSCALVRADFTYQETTQMTGGSMLQMMRMAGPFAKQAREPNVSTHMIKGDRMVTMTKDRASIIDLGKETITEVDFAKKTYSVMTFAEMKQAIEDAMSRMQSKSGAANTDAKMSVSAKATGETKTVQGLPAKELIVTMTMEGTDEKSGQSAAMNTVMDSWRAVVPGYDEVRAFHKKMGEKMGYLFGSGMAQMGMTRPELARGMAEVAKESAKLDGMPVETVVKMGGSATGQPSSADAPPPQQQQQQQSGGRLSGLGGLAGGLGGFGRKKPKDQQSGDASSQQQQQGSGTLIEMTTQLSSYNSESVDASKFAVPAGFKQVESEMRRHAR